MSAAPSIPESTATLEAAQAGLLYERYSAKILGYCRRRLSSRGWPRKNSTSLRL